MNRSHVILSELWRSCNGDLNKLTEQERKKFEDAMWEHCDYIDRLKVLDEALKTWAKTQEGKQ